MFVYQRVALLTELLSRAANTTSLPILTLEYTSRSAQATPRRSERSVTRRVSGGQQVSCAVVYVAEFGYQRVLLFASDQSTPKWLAVFERWLQWQLHGFSIRASSKTVGRTAEVIPVFYSDSSKCFLVNANP